MIKNIIKKIKLINIKIIVPIIIIIIFAYFSFQLFTFEHFTELFTDALATLLAVFIGFCITQLFYQNMKKPLFSFFIFRKEEKYEEYEEYEDEKIKKNYYKVGSIIDGKQLIETFKKYNIIGISWNDLGDINELMKTEDKSDDNIRTAVKEKIEKLKEENNSYYSKLTPTYISQIAGFFVKLMSMKEGDIVSIPVSGKLHLFTVSGKYKYRKDLEGEKIAHSVAIDKTSEVIVDLADLDFLNFTPTFKRAAQNRLTIISLNQYSTQIESLIE